MREKDIIISQLIETKHSQEIQIASKDDEIKDLKVFNDHREALLN